MRATGRVYGEGEGRSRSGPASIRLAHYAHSRVALHTMHPYLGGTALARAPRPADDPSQTTFLMTVGRLRPVCGEGTPRETPWLYWGRFPPVPIVARCQLPRPLGVRHRHTWRG